MNEKAQQAMAWRGSYEWLIGTRYLRSGQRRGFLSFITGISIVGLALGVAVLLVVMSVMKWLREGIAFAHSECHFPRHAQWPAGNTAGLA